VTLRLEVLPAGGPSVPASPSIIKAAAAVTTLPAAEPLPAAATNAILDTPALGSDQNSPHSVPAPTAKAAAAEATGHLDDSASEQQKWLGIRRSLRGDTTKTHIKHVDSNSWTPVNQVCVVACFLL
jgi:hypothetical protein